MSWLDDFSEPVTSTLRKVGEVAADIGSGGASNLESLTRGAVASVPGVLGDIESLGRKGINWSFGAGGVRVPEETVLPTTEDILKKMPERVTPARRESAGMEELGTAMAPGLAKGAAPLAKTAVRELAPTAGAMAMKVAEVTGAPVRGMGVVKQKGGNWFGSTVEESVDPLKQNVLNDLGLKNLAERAGADVAEEVRINQQPVRALNDWVDKKLGGYIKNELGTSSDPVRKLAEEDILHVDPEALNFNLEAYGKYPLDNQQFMAKSDKAKAWEGASDLKIGSGERENPYRPGEQMTEHVIAAPRNLPKDLGFDHLVDELKNAINPNSGLPRNLQLTPEKLEKVSVPDAVRLVSKINDWRAAQKVEADLARANNPATVLYKDYPETGQRWVELKLPEIDKLPEGYEVRPLERNGETRYAVYDSKGKQTGGVGKTPEEAIKNEQVGMPHLETSLKYEGEAMGHCVGGYCPDVASGSSRIFSLRDAKGQPHVTVEMRPGRRTGERAVDYRELLPENYAKRYGDDSDLGFEVAQIKGKGNKGVSEKYREQVVDFLNSGDFKKVSDLSLNDIVDTSDAGSLMRTLETIYDNKDLGKGIDAFNVAAEQAPNTARFMTRSNFLKFLGVGGAAGAAGAAQAQTKEPKVADTNWLDEVSTPKAKAEDTSYDMSEFSAPKDETTVQRIKRLGRSAASEMGLSEKRPAREQGRVPPEAVKQALLGAGEAGLQALTGAASSAVGGLAGLARGGYSLMSGEGGGEALRKTGETIEAVQKAGTYEPRTETGKAIGELAAAPFSMASEYGGKALKPVGGAIGEAVGGERGRIYGEAAGQSVGELAVPVGATLLGGRGAMKEAAKEPVAVAPKTPKEAAAIKAQETGYVLPPSEARPSLLNRFITGYGGKIQTEQAASVKNQVVTNNLVKKALGIAEDAELTPETLDSVRANAGKAYQAVKDTKEPIYSNEAYKKSIDDLSKDWQAAERDFPEIAKGKSEIADLQKMMDKAQISPTGAIEMVKELRSSAKTNMKAFDDPAKQALGRAQKQAANALDQLVEDNLKENTIVTKANPNLVKDYRAARELIAKSYDVETAMTNAGNVSAAKLGKLLKGGRLSGYLKDVAEFGETFKKSAQLPEAIGTTPGISPLDTATAGIEGTAALAAGKPGLAAGAVGTVLGRPAARSIGLSERYQRGPGSAQQFDMSGRQLGRKISPVGAAGAQSAVERQEQ